MLTAALTYGYDLDGRENWNIRELDHHGEPHLFWLTSADVFFAEATARLKAAEVDVVLVRYGDENSGTVGHILAASVDVENGPVSRPFDASIIALSPGSLAEHDVRLTAALAVLGITPTEIKYRNADPTPAKPGWMTSAYQA